MVFTEYPVWPDPSEEDIGCMTLPGELPPRVPVVPACAALQADGRPASALFQDTNHLTEEGNRIFGEAVAEVLAEL